MSNDVNDLDEILQVLKLEKDLTNKQTLKDYIDLLFKWHEKNNILSTRNRKYFFQRDMHDSLSILNYLPRGNVLDIGTGAGIPGMLLSFFTTDNIILLDRRQNAIRFLEHAKLKLGLNNVRIIKSDINEMNIDESLSCVLIKNFSNKIVSKLSFEDKINYIAKVIRNRIDLNIPIYILTGSIALKTKDFSDELKARLRSDFIVTKIQTPYFDTNRYLLEIRYV